MDDVGITHHCTELVGAGFGEEEVMERKRTARRTVRLGVAVAVGALGLAGCNQADPEASSSARECPAIAEKPAEGNGKVVYWSMWTKGEPQQEVLQRTFDCFTEETGIEVDAQWFGRTVLTQNVAPALNTDTVPDVIDQDVSQVNAAVAQPGGLQDVSDVMDMPVGEDDKTVGDVLDPGVVGLDANKLPDGGQMLVPYELLSNAWWYDAGSVDDFEQPETSDDLFALFDAAKESGRAAVSQDGDIDFYNAYFFTQWAEQFVGPGGLLAAAQDESGSSWTDEPGFLESAKLVERLAQGEYLIDGWDASKFPSVQNQWADGKSGYLFVGSWITSEASEYLKKQSGTGEVDFDFASFPMPQADGATHTVTEVLPIGFGITEKAANPDAAKALLAYASHVDNIEGFATEADNLVPRVDVEAPEALADVKARLDDPEVEKTIFMDGIDGQAADWTTEVFYPLNNSLLKGQITAEEFISQISAKSKAFY